MTTKTKPAAEPLPRIHADYTSREIIALLRENRAPVALLREELALLADFAEEGLASMHDVIVSECPRDGEWFDTTCILDGTGDSVELDEGLNVLVTKAASLLDRSGAIERKPGEPHMVRFVEG